MAAIQFWLSLSCFAFELAMPVMFALHPALSGLTGLQWLFI